MNARRGAAGRTIRILLESGVSIEGELAVPAGARSIVLFAHGSGSSRFSPRNNYVAEVLRNAAGFGTLLFDLLTQEEDQLYENRFDINLLTERLVAATNWTLKENPQLGICYFGASTGAAAALGASTEFEGTVKAIVSRGGRPDLTSPSRLGEVTAPTLLIVGGRDTDVLELNRRALSMMNRCHEKGLEVVEGATHLFEEPGALEEVSKLASNWFQRFAPIT